MNKMLTRPGRLAMVGFIAALTQGEFTVRAIVERTGLHAQTVRDYIVIMRRQKLLYVSDWCEDKQGRLGSPAYSLGNKPDARRPLQKLTGAERTIRYRSKRRYRELLHTTAGTRTPDPIRTQTFSMFGG